MAAKDMSKKLTTFHQEPRGHDKRWQHVLRLLQKQRPRPNSPICLCIGSDRYTGDALGPLVGTFLKDKGLSFVYGTLDEPVHAGNLVETIDKIYKIHQDPLIIAVDACLGRAHEIGQIEIWEGPIEAGIAVGHCLPKVGHIALVGVVNVGSSTGYLELQSTSLSLVMKLSHCIGEALVYAFAEFQSLNMRSQLV